MKRKNRARAQKRAHQIAQIAVARDSQAELDSMLVSLDAALDFNESEKRIVHGVFHALSHQKEQMPIEARKILAPMFAEIFVVRVIEVCKIAFHHGTETFDVSWDLGECRWERMIERLYMLIEHDDAEGEVAREMFLASQIRLCQTECVTATTGIAIHA